MKEQSSFLTKEQESAILHDIEMINFKRMKLLLTIFLICEILFITLNDIPNLMNAGILNTIFHIYWWIFCVSKGFCCNIY